MTRVVGLVIGALFVAILAFQLSRDNTEIEDPEPNSVEREPDLYGENVRFQELRPDGSPHYSLNAAAIRQYEADALTRMTKPDLHLINIDQPPWDIAANLGYLRRRPGPLGVEEDVVFLREEVNLTQTHPDRGLVSVRSEALYIYPNREYAETDLDVMIDTEVGRTKAGGLKIDLNSGLLKLSSSEVQRVHTIVLPEQFKKK